MDMRGLAAVVAMAANQRCATVQAGNSWLWLAPAVLLAAGSIARAVATVPTMSPKASVSFKTCPPSQASAIASQGGACHILAACGLQMQ